VAGKEISARSLQAQEYADWTLAVNQIRKQKKAGVLAGLLAAIRKTDFRINSVRKVSSRLIARFNGAPEGI